MKSDQWHYYHELGHGIIAHIFNGYLYNFEKITIDEKEIKEVGLNDRDKAYTIARPIEGYQEVISQNNHNTALVDGLYLLSGVGGASFFGSSSNFNEVVITPSNFRNLLVLDGSDGDFEIINRGNRPYGWLLKMKAVSKKNREILQCKLFQILKLLFTKPEIAEGSSILLKKLLINKRLTAIDFQEIFDSAFTASLQAELFLKLSPQEFGVID